MAVIDDTLRLSMQSLYSEHHGWLQGWLRGKTGCSHQAADLAQDTFVQVLVARQPVEMQEPRAYLTTIAKRVLFNFWRRRDLEQAYLEALANTSEIVVPSLEEQALVIEALMAVDRVLDAMPYKVKQVFLLNQLQELTYKQIGERLDLPVITVRRYMKRAIQACCGI